jgi:hypothetical protein
MPEEGNRPLRLTMILYADFLIADPEISSGE